MKTHAWLLAASALLLIWGCGKSEKERPKRPVLPVPQVQAPAPDPASEKATEAEEALAEKKAEEEAFAACCTTLKKRGFEDRSMEYMAASRACESAGQEGKSLADVSSDLAKELKDKALPGACKAN